MGQQLVVLNQPTGIEPIHQTLTNDKAREAAGRCTGCLVQHCGDHGFGCPLNKNWGTIISELQRGGYTDEAIKQAYWNLRGLDPFPELTQACTAYCEVGCSKGSPRRDGTPPVQIRDLEGYLVRQAARLGLDREVVRLRPQTGKQILIVGSGPGGLTAACHLASAGHAVTVCEAGSEIGGLLANGVSLFHRDANWLDNPLHRLLELGVRFLTNTRVGVEGNSLVKRDDGRFYFKAASEKRRQIYDSVIFAVGASIPRRLGGVLAAANAFPQVTLAPEAYEWATKGLRDRDPLTVTVPPNIASTNWAVVILGGGLTGHDVAEYYRALGYTVYFIISGSIPGDPAAWASEPSKYTQIVAESTVNPIFDASVTKIEQIDDGLLRVTYVVKGETKTVEVGRLVVSRGFTAPRQPAIIGLGVETNSDSFILVNERGETNVIGVYGCGDGVKWDTGRPNDIVWSIRQGLDVAYTVDHTLMGNTVLVSPSHPNNLAPRL